MLLPTAERRGEIHFYIAKGLAYGPRLAIAFGLMALGLIIEVVLMESFWWAGLPVVLAGVIMLLSKGFDNTVKTKRAKEEWRPARREEVARIVELNRQQKKWDQDAIDITCTRGFLTLVAVAVIIGLIARFVLGASVATLTMLGANAAVMLLPFWITGARSILKNDRLVIKSELLLELGGLFERAKRPGEEFQYQMQTTQARDGSGEVPDDVKALVLFHEAPETFLGLQLQVAINSVQGKDYPYFYCVLVARPAFGGLGRDQLDPPPHRILIEPKREGDVDIAVIRQKTTKKSGYHTKPRVAARIFDHGLSQARKSIAACH